MNAKKVALLLTAALVMELAPWSARCAHAQPFTIYYGSRGPHPYYSSSSVQGIPDSMGRPIDHTYNLPQQMIDASYLGPGYGPGYSYFGSYTSESITPYTSGGTIPAASTSIDNRATFRLTVPENAEVLFDKQRTNQVGPVRAFTTPVLEPGRTYEYDIRVFWKEGSRERGIDRHVHFQVGDQVDLDFTKLGPGNTTEVLGTPGVHPNTSGSTVRSP